jgi:group I intron endonuclease
MKIFGQIYLLRNKVTGTMYVGQTVRSLTLRSKQHATYAAGKPTVPIDQAIRKYGIEQFTIDLLEVAFSREELNLLEQEWIDKLLTMVPNGYNVRKDAKGQSGWKHSEATLKKLKIKARARAPVGEITRLLHSLAWKGKKRTAKHVHNQARGHRVLDDVRTRMIKDDPRKQRAIAREFGVSPSTICRIKRGRSCDLPWKQE